jgi:hypothetical protein
MNGPGEETFTEWPKPGGRFAGGSEYRPVYETKPLTAWLSTRELSRAPAIAHHPSFM